MHEHPTRLLSQQEKSWHVHVLPSIIRNVSTQESNSDSTRNTPTKGVVKWDQSNDSSRGALALLTISFLILYAFE